MVSDNPVDPVRAKVIHMFSAQGDSPDTELSESLLLCDGGYRGRQFARGNKPQFGLPIPAHLPSMRTVRKRTS